MRRFHVVLLAVLAATAAEADTTLPVALDTAHRCQYPIVGGGAVDASYPVVFMVLADGSVENLHGAKPADDPLVDHAAQRCARAWRYKPATKDGKPVMHDWHETIAWDVTPFATISARPPPSENVANADPVSIGRPHVCNTSYPQAAVDAHAEGRVTLTFIVATDGSTKDHKIAVSSGNADLDEAAIKCAGRWRYKPGIKDGQPVETLWQASVLWSLRDLER